MKKLATAIIVSALTTGAQAADLSAYINGATYDTSGADYRLKSVGLNLALLDYLHIGGTYGDEISRDKGAVPIDEVSSGYVRIGRSTGTNVFLYAGGTYTNIDYQGGAVDSAGWSVGVAYNQGHAYFGFEYAQPRDNVDGVNASIGFTF